MDFSLDGQDDHFDFVDGDADDVDVDVDGDAGVDIDVDVDVGDVNVVDAEGDVGDLYCSKPLSSLPHPY